MLKFGVENEYLAPTMRNIAVRCEAGFEESTENEGVPKIRNYHPIHD